MAITAKDVMDLRNKTGLGMMECKQALAEAGGNMDEAVDILRKKGLAKMDTRADRSSADGRIACAVAGDQSKAAIVEVNSETDFTAGTDAFKAMIQRIANEALKQPAGQAAKTQAMQDAIDEVRLVTKENVQFNRGWVLGGGAGSKVGHYVHFTGKVGVLVELMVSPGATVPDELLSDLCMHVTAATPTPLAVTDAGVPKEVLDKERQIAKAQAMEQGKPEQIAEKMVEGKIRKFLDDCVLLRQLFIKDDKKRIADLLPKGVTIEAFIRYQVGVS